MPLQASNVKIAIHAVFGPSSLNGIVFLTACSVLYVGVLANHRMPFSFWKKT